MTDPREMTTGEAAARREEFKQETRVLWDAPPYRPWLLNPAAAGPWGIKGAGGWNCYGRDGAVFLATQAAAEAVIRAAGHEPGKAE